MIKNKLRSILKNRGISIVKLSKETGLNRRTIYQFMNNKGLTYNLNTMNTICNYLSMNISDIIYYSENDVDFKIYRKQNNVDFYPTKINKHNYYVTSFYGYIQGIKDDKKISFTHIDIDFFKFNGQFFLGYDLGNLRGYEQSIFSNNENMVKLAKIFIKHVLDYAQAMKVAKNHLKNNSDILGIPDDCLEEYSKLPIGKIYDLQIIPLYQNADFPDKQHGKRPIMYNYSDSSVVNLHAQIYETKDQKINIVNPKNKKHFGYMYNLMPLLNDLSLYLRNIDE